MRFGHYSKICLQRDRSGERQTEVNMDLKEATICSVAVDKLRSDGWKVACELSVFYHPVDAVASKNGILMAIEAKTSFTKTLKKQLMGNMSFSDLLVAVVGTNPNKANIEWCRKLRIGIWVVKSNKINEVLSPKALELDPVEYLKSKVLELVNRYSENDVAGGTPNQKGIGPAQDVKRRVDQYRLNHPKATWKEIFNNVPNHYSNHKNMYSALRSNKIGDM